MIISLYKIDISSNYNQKTRVSFYQFVEEFMKSHYFRAARAIVNKSIREVSGSVNIPPSTLSRLENLSVNQEVQKNKPPIIRLIKYYQQAGIDITIEGIIMLSEFEEKANHI
jgi:hypothetical protein